MMAERFLRLWMTCLLMTIVCRAGFGQDVPAMAANADPAFEVATIRPSNSDDHRQGFHTDGHRIFIENETLETLITFAYSLHRSQIAGAPAWAGTERFDIHGVPDPAGRPSPKQQQVMLQKLLAERFALKFNREQRELSIYTLTVGKGGPRLEKTKSDPNALLDQTGNSSNSRQSWRLTNNSINDFAQFLQAFLDKPIVNQTGLAGKFDFHLDWTPNDLQVTDPAAPPELLTAVREQLGLNLAATRGQANVLVVTHVEQPSTN